jgi:L-threonylcarbamoyladenylate synthase
MSHGELAPYLEQLAAGRAVAIATESFFGLLADARSQAALSLLFSLKPRGADKGVPLVLPSRAAWDTLVAEVPPLAEALTDALWPGPLSVSLPALASVDPRVALAGQVAVRVPGPSPARELVERYGAPLTATSANLPGAPPAVRFEEVTSSFAEAVADGRLLVHWAPSPGGAPSTVVAFRDGRIEIAREGAIPKAKLAQLLAERGASLDANTAHR